MDRETVSIWHCKPKFGHYATFAALALRIAIENQEEYDSASFEHAIIGLAHRNNLTARERMAGLAYHDKGYFSIEEYQFFLNFFENYGDRSDEQVEEERQELLRALEKGSVYMLNWHIKCLLKAIDYWKWRHKDKSEEWAEEMKLAVRAACLRSRVRQEAWLAARRSDEGYYSVEEDDDEEDEEEEE